MELNIVCVYKSGNIYNWEYVNNMYYCISKYLKLPFHFFCFTDTVKTSTTIENNFTAIPLEYNLKKWWSKLEAFRVVGTVIYFDLDTVIVKNIDWTAKKMLDEYQKIQNNPSQEMNKIFMLKISLFMNKWSNSIMAWIGDWTWLLTQFSPIHARFYDWEQKYISLEITKRGLPIYVSQSLFRENIYSHKIFSDKRKIPVDACAVYFHGRPKPHEVGGIYFPIAEKEETK